MASHAAWRLVCGCNRSQRRARAFFRLTARVQSHSRLGPEGQMGHLITNALARPFSISFSDSQTLAGKPTITFGDQPKPSAIRLVNLSAFIRLLPS